MDRELEDDIIVGSSGDDGKLGFEQEGHVRETPFLLYWEEKFFLTVGMSFEWKRKRMRALSRSSSFRYDFFSYFSLESFSKSSFFDPLMLSRTCPLFLLTT